MTTTRMIAADELDPSAVADLFRRTGGQPICDAFLAWALHPPAGTAHVAVTHDHRGLRAISALRPMVVRHRGAREISWQRCVRAGTDDSVLHDVDSALSTSLPTGSTRLCMRARTERTPPPPWRSLATARTWITGPDPFVPLQPGIEGFDARHDRLDSAQDVLAGLVKDAAYLTWRYLDHPVHDYVIMGLQTPNQAEALVVVRQARVRSRKAIVVLELMATESHLHYAMLKAARKLAWDRGGLPVAMLDDGMQRLYAFTAGYVAVPKRLLPRFEVSVDGPLFGDRTWSASLGDWSDY